MIRHKLSARLVTIGIMWAGLTSGQQVFATDMKFWQSRGNQTCEAAANQVKERFSRVTEWPSLVSSSQLINDQTCEILISYRSNPGDESRVTFNYSGIMRIEPELPLFRFATIANCEAERQEVERFYFRGSHLTPIASGCYTHHDSDAVYLVIAGGKHSEATLYVRDFSRVYVDSVQRSREAELERATTNLHLVAWTKAHRHYYFSNNLTDRDLSRSIPNVDDESPYVIWLNQSLPLLFASEAECSRHLNQFVKRAFLAKAATEILDERCIYAADHEKYQAKLLIVGKVKPEYPGDWSWREVEEKSYQTLEACENYVEVIEPDGFCRYAPWARAYVPMKWWD
jgi:hypothetical protein